MEGGDEGNLLQTPLRISYRPPYTEKHTHTHIHTHTHTHTHTLQGLNPWNCNSHIWHEVEYYTRDTP